MPIQNTYGPALPNSVSATGETSLLGNDLEKNVESVSRKDTFTTGGAFILVACAAQGAKYFINHPEFKPPTGFTDPAGIVQKCGIWPVTPPISRYHLQGCSIDQNACDNVELDEEGCQQPPGCVGTPTIFNCNFVPGSPLTGSELVSACFNHQVTCLSENMQYKVAESDFLRIQAKNDSTHTNLNYLTGAALLGVLLAQILGRGHRA